MKRFMAGMLIAVGLALSAGEALAAEREPSARCRDGSLSYSANRRGTCSGHGGVAEWLSGSQGALKAPSEPQEQAIRTVPYNDPTSACGRALARSVAPLGSGWTEECVTIQWPVEYPWAIGLAYFAERAIKYRTDANLSDAHWDYLVAHERCHSLGITDEVATDRCAARYGADLRSFGYYTQH